MSSKLQQVKDEIIQLPHTSVDAVTSATYLYPLDGLIYLVRHTSLWPPVLSRIIPCFALSFGILVPMFLVTYVPQAAILTLMNGPIGPINAVALVLSESTMLINLIARAFLLQGALYDVFDATLVSEGMTDLVGKGRELKSGVKNHEGAKKLGKMLMKPLQKFSPASLIEYILLLPLNLIPIVGTVVFLIIQGRRTGPSYHERYFQLKQYDGKTKDQFIQKNKGRYIAFGTMSMIMNLVPFASIIFTFTSTVGAALWAAEIERGASHPGATIQLSPSKPDTDSGSGSGKKDL